MIVAVINLFLRTVARAPVRIALSMVILGVVVGGALFSLFEHDASWYDGMYWATVVIPTVGFGDFSPHTLGGRWAYELVVLDGWLATLILGGAIGAAIFKHEVAPWRETPELDDDIDHLIDLLDQIKKRVNHPEVVAALQRISATGATEEGADA